MNAMCAMDIHAVGSSLLKVRQRDSVANSSLPRPRPACHSGRGGHLLAAAPGSAAPPALMGRSSRSRSRSPSCSVDSAGWGQPASVPCAARFAGLSGASVPSCSRPPRQRLTLLLRRVCCSGASAPARPQGLPRLVLLRLPFWGTVVLNPSW
ncbi:hypothetical protein VPH35_007970 [Triticum aestivum]